LKNPFKKDPQRIKVKLDDGNLKGEKKPFFKRLAGKLFKYRLSFNIVRVTEKADVAAPPADADFPQQDGIIPVEEPAAETTEAADNKKAKKKKPKKEKKPKEKKPKEKKVKEKKPKPAKKAAAKSAKEGEDGEDSGNEAARAKKRKVFLIIGIVVGAVLLVGGGAFAAMLVLDGNAPTPEELLAKAIAYTAEAEYDKAESIYEDLFAEKENLETTLLADVYLGLAENRLASSETVDSVIFTLEEGLAATADPRIQERIDELRPPEEGAEPASPPDEAVSFADPEFERMIRQGLGKSASQAIIRSELSSIQQLKIVGGTHVAMDAPLNSVNRSSGYTIDGVSYSEHGGITSLQDVRYFPALTKLVVCYNKVRDIAAVSELVNLDTLGLYFNEIKDISPIANLTSLRYLYAYNNQIASLAPVKNLSAMEELWVQHNQIGDLSPVSGLKNLKELFVSDNLITDISPIAGLPSLGFFYASNNQITDISAVAQTPSLTDVTFAGNPVTDMSPAGKVRNVNKPLFAKVSL
jgi:hypothetical protein